MMTPVDALMHLPGVEHSNVYAQAAYLRPLQSALCHVCHKALKHSLIPITGGKGQMLKEVYPDAFPEKDSQTHTVPIVLLES